jgi:hypothetical protein
VFGKIRDKLFSAFNRYGLKYKVFGGTVMNFLDDSRGTSDVDMTIKQDMAEVHKFADALMECGYGTKEEIFEGVFGADPQTEEYLFALSRIYSDNPEFAGFHIDLTFDFGQIKYDAIETVEQTVNGITVNMATLPQMLKLKKGTDPLLAKDIRDISFLENMIGADEPI